MSDIVDQIFDRVRPEPDPAFVAALHQRALAELNSDLDLVVRQVVEDETTVEFAIGGRPRRRHRGRRRTAAVVLAVAAAAALLALVLREPASQHPVVPATSVSGPSTSAQPPPSTSTTPPSTTVPGSAPVPKVKGLTRDQARAAIEAAGFTYAGSGENLAPCPQAGVLSAWDTQPAVDVATAPGAVVTVRYYCPLSHFVDATG
jgi:hypothetical protein